MYLLGILSLLLKTKDSERIFDPSPLCLTEFRQKSLLQKGDFSKITFVHMDQHIHDQKKSSKAYFPLCLIVGGPAKICLPCVSAYFFTKVFVQYIQIFLNCFFKYSYSFPDLPLKFSKVNGESRQFMIQRLSCKTQCAFQVIYLSPSFNQMSCFLQLHFIHCLRSIIAEIIDFGPSDLF